MAIQSDMFKTFLTYLKDQGLIFLAGLLLIGMAILGVTSQDLKGQWIILVVLSLTGLGALALYYRQRSNKEAHNLSEKIAELKGRLKVRPNVVTPKDYIDTLKLWNKSGPGYVLLYNIELQSFKDPKILKGTWGDLSKLENIKKVVLLLPSAKARRWEHVVVKEMREGGFFADKANRKFDMCEFFDNKETDNHLKTGGIAFALYRKGSSPTNGDLHPKTAVFVLSEPFSSLRDPYTENDDPWWDYHHVLLFGDDPTIRVSTISIWNQHFDPSKTLSVEEVQKGVEPLRPIRPEDLFEQINMAADRRIELLKHLGKRSVTTESPRVIPLDQPGDDFEIIYDSGEVVCGHCSGIDSEERQPRQALVCVGGFTEYHQTKLMDIFEKQLKKEAVVQFFYEVSPEIEYATLSHYAEDLRAVLNYVNSQRNVVIPDKLVLIARSINGFLAAMVGAEEEFTKMLSGIILVAPVFDVIEMMDNYRAIQGDAHVRIKKLWRRQHGYDDAAEWECRTRDPDEPGRNWLNFFNQNVSLAVMADIIQQDDPNRFRLKSFVDYVGTLSQRFPVYILSNTDDPITASKEAMQALNSAASGSGKIRSDYYNYIEIHSSHDIITTIHNYPWEVREETQKTHEALNALLAKVGIATIV